MSGIIFVGWINKGRPADCGETMKNQLIVNRLEQLGIECRQMDFKRWRKHPWVFIQLAWNMVIHKNFSLILSTSAQNIYPLMKFLKQIKWKQNTIHWVIGGNTGRNIKQGIYQADVMGYMKHTLVETRLMVEQFTEVGIKDVLYVPNFKPINYYPKIGKKYPQNGYSMKFVFLSRIMPEKGCDYIIEASKMLNQEGYKNKYTVTFYGSIADNYKNIFRQKIDAMENVNYGGFLNLRTNQGYDELASYDVMLFPTYWVGEGFAGVFIDAFISGLPIIASDWAHNSSILNEDVTGWLIKVNNVVDLYKKMKECINGKYNIEQMSRECQKQANEYNIDNIIDRGLLKKIGVI